jgi:hypothetical protein
MIGTIQIHKKPDMAPSRRSFHYRIGGLKVTSQIEMPFYHSLEKNHFGTADVNVRLSRARVKDTQASYCDDYIRCSPGDFLFKVNDALSFRIQDGQRITIYADADCDARDILIYLLGSAWGVLCHQRGQIPIHCSAVSRSGQAIAFCGPSGAGKSTLAVALTQCGFTHLCDDLSLFKHGPSGPALRPIDKGVKLWQSAAHHMGLKMGTRVSTTDGQDKSYIELGASSSNDYYDLRALYVLRETTDEKISIIPITGLERLNVLLENIYRAEWLPLLRDSPTLFAQISKLAQNLEIYAFQRPRNLARLTEGRDQIAAHFERHLTELKL